MTININDILCVKCGQRGFKRITGHGFKLECNNCHSQVYSLGEKLEHEQTKKEQSAAN